MRQRVVIAMAMACKPRLLIADEPTTALDVTIQAEILALIDRLKRENGMAVLFITHDMAVVAQMADRVVVMYRGEHRRGRAGRATSSPHPQQDYTRALLAAVPKLGEMRGKTAPEPMRIIGAARRRRRARRRRQEPTSLLEVEHLTTRFPVQGGMLRRTVAKVHAVEDVSFSVLTRRDAVAGRRIRLRQVLLRTLDPAARRGRIRRHPARRLGRPQARPRSICAARGATCR